MKIRQFFQLSIGNKINSLSILYLSFSILGVFITQWGIQKMRNEIVAMQQIQNTTSLFEKVHQSILVSRSFEKDFFQKNNEKSVDGVKKSVQASKMHLQQFQKNNKNNKIQRYAKKVEALLSDYLNTFLDVVSFHEIRGFTAKDGFHGRFNRSAQKLENEFKTIQDYELHTQLLLIQKYEQKYLQGDRTASRKVRGYLHELKIKTKKKIQSLNKIKQIYGFIDVYRSNFDRVVLTNIQTQSSIRSFYKNVSQIPPIIEKINQIVLKEQKQSILKTQQLQKNISQRMILLSILAVGLVMVLGFLISRSITKPIRETVNLVEEIAQGNLNAKIETNRSDEMGTLSRRFDQMRNAISKKIQNLNELNKTGETLAKYQDKKDVILTILKVLKSQFQAKEGFIYLNNNQNEMHLKAFFPKEECMNSLPSTLLLSIDIGLINKCIEQKEIQCTALFNSLENNDDLALFLNQKSILCIPLLDDEKVIGVVTLCASENHFILEEYNLQFAATLARMMVSSLKNLQMMKVIQKNNQTLEDKVQKRTKDIQSLLDNTGQGFISFGKDFKVKKDYSKACLDFFQKYLEEHNLKTLKGTSVFDFLCKSNDEKKNIKELFDMLFNGLGTLEMIDAFLPKTVQINENIFSVVFRNVKGITHHERYMVILTDITKELQLEKHIQEETTRNALIVKVALNKDSFIIFVREIRSIFQTTEKELKKRTQNVDSNALYRLFHTIKGGTASYALKNVAAIAHELEDILGENSELSSKSHLMLNEKFFQLQRLFDESLESIQELIPDELDEKFYQISEKKLIEFEDMLLEGFGISYQNQIKKLIDRFCAKPIGPVFQRYAQVAKDLAVDLQKKIEIEIKGEDVEVNFKHMETVLESLIHLVRNSVDHGMENPEERKKLGKPEIGKISFEAFRSNGQLILEFMDDGKGIDPNKIKEIALTKQFIDFEQAEQMSEQDAVHLIFHPRFSTKEEVSVVSGRGVGMDAVKTKIDELKGKINIDTKKGVGTKFQIEIPLFAVA
ncbi:MAG: two-component system chemotaxis sensor kinase CheA [bacterium]|jgi:two-component system chemotaxis sensor kinase CheA